MLAIACALIQTPKLLLLDELSLGLAPVIVERLLPVVREFATERQVAVVLVEQHVRLGLDIADRAYVLAHGDLTASGSAEELRERHRPARRELPRRDARRRLTRTSSIRAATERRQWAIPFCRISID